MSEYDKIEKRLTEINKNTSAGTRVRHFELVVNELMATGSVSIDLIAMRFDVTPSTLRRHAIELTGLTPSKLMMYFRLRQCLNLMRTYPGITISEIALRCAFYDKAHFANTFSRYFGTTPSKYVEEHF